MDAEQFQKAIGTREKHISELTSNELAEYICLIISEIIAHSDVAEQYSVYLFNGDNLTGNVNITDSLCMVLGLVAEYATFKGYKLSELMTRAIHLRNQRNNDMSGVN